jgi:hypothetical protein
MLTILIVEDDDYLYRDVAEIIVEACGNVGVIGRDEKEAFKTALRPPHKVPAGFDCVIAGVQITIVASVAQAKEWLRQHESDPLDVPLILVFDLVLAEDETQPTGERFLLHLLQRRSELLRTPSGTHTPPTFLSRMEVVIYTINEPRTELSRFLANNKLQNIIIFKNDPGCLSNLQSQLEGVIKRRVGMVP